MMSTDVAAHIRIFQLDPTDDYVQKRTDAIAAIKKRFQDLDKTNDILYLVNELIVVTSSSTVRSELLTSIAGTAIKEQSPSFVAADEPLQIAVCALIAALDLISESSPTTLRLSRTELLAAGIWCGLSFRPLSPTPRLSELLATLIEAARRLVKKSSHVNRQRTKVNAVAITYPEAYEAKAVSEATASALTKTVDALRSNAALDREELDLLWWAVNDWSELLEKPMTSLATSTSMIARALEFAKLLRRLPGDAHRHLAFRHLPADSDLTLTELIDQIDANRAALTRGIESSSILSRCRSAFPLLSAITSGVQATPGAEVKRSLLEWGERALLEAAILHICTLSDEMN